MAESIAISATILALLSFISIVLGVCMFLVFWRCRSTERKKTRWTNSPSEIRTGWLRSERKPLVPGLFSAKIVQPTMKEDDTDQVTTWFRNIWIQAPFHAWGGGTWYAQVGASHFILGTGHWMSTRGAGEILHTPWIFLTMKIGCQILFLIWMSHEICLECSLKKLVTSSSSQIPLSWAWKKSFLRPSLLHTLWPLCDLFARNALCSSYSLRNTGTCEVQKEANTFVYYMTICMNIKDNVNTS